MAANGPRDFFVYSTIDPGIADGDEHVIATLDNIATGLPNPLLDFTGGIDCQPDGATTAVQLLIRQGDIAGQVVGGGTVDLVAGQAGTRLQFTAEGGDTPPSLDNAVYVLTVQFGAAAGASGITRIKFRAILTPDGAVLLD